MRAWILILSGCVALSAACGDDSLDVRGQTDRVVGETVTLELIEGETGFSGAVRLEAAGGITYETDLLGVSTEGDSELSFVIPAGIPLGGATVRAEKADTSGDWVVPLQVNRLALTMDADGLMELFPLDPATLEPNALSLGESAARLDVVPGGGAIAVMNDQVVKMIALGETLRDVSVPVPLEGGTCLAAVPGGALAATATTVVRIIFSTQATSTQFALPGCKSIAASADGTRAAVLAPCDADGDTVVDGDCVIELALGEEELVEGKKVLLDEAEGAALLDVTDDGKGVVVAAQNKLYGVWLDAEPPQVTSVSWSSPARPVGIDHATARVQSVDIDLFAVADGDQGRLSFVGFNPEQGHSLQQAADVALPKQPVAISYGRGTQLYIAADQTLYALEAGQGNPQVQELTITPQKPVVHLVVQP